ncbi:MAG: ATP-binding protein [Opitutales bacterium]|nr:ATP-binding protein [Opitutales bacterium]
MEEERQENGPVNPSENHPEEGRDLAALSIVRALDLADVGVVRTDSRGYIVEISATVGQLFALNLSQSIHWTQLLQEDGEDLWSDGLEDAFLEDGFWKGEGWCDSKSKGRIAVNLVMRRLHDGGRIILLRDVTEVKRSEEQLLEEKQGAEHLNARLEQEIQKVNELAVMAERANIAKSVFLTSMSHEFRTPLNGILGYSQILQRDSRLSPENREAAAVIERCGKHLLALINDVLDLSKIESGKVQAEWEPTHLKLIATEVADVFRVRCESKGIELRAAIGRDKGFPDWVIGDAKLLRQILINLVGNAVKFTDRGYVKIEASLVAEENPGDEEGEVVVRFAVSDTGSGIDKAHLDQIFEEFFQTEAFSGHKGGTGLGLSISRKLVACMGGRLRVESEIGKGSRFWFDLKTRRVRSRQKGESRSDFAILGYEGAPIGVRLDALSPIEDEVLGRAFRDLGFDVRRTSLDSGSDCVPDGSVRFVVLREDYLNRSFLSGAIAGDLSGLEGRSNPITCVVLATGESVIEPLPAELVEHISVRYLPAPIQITALHAILGEASDVRWKTQTEAGAEIGSPSGGGKQENLSDAKPSASCMQSWLMLAQIGDTKGLKDEIERWENTQKQPTALTAELRSMIKTYRIDAICTKLGGFISGESR